MKSHTAFFFSTISSFLPLLDYDQHDRKVIIMRPGCFDPMLHKPETPQADIDMTNLMISDTMGWEMMIINKKMMINTFKKHHFSAHSFSRGRNGRGLFLKGREGPESKRRLSLGLYGRLQ